jgi:hypothetical protein
LGSLILIGDSVNSNFSGGLGDHQYFLSGWLDGKIKPTLLPKAEVAKMK